MIQTKTKKALALLSIAALTTASFANTYAATKIGTGSVTGNSTFNSDVMWNDVFPWTATGTVSEIVVTAKVAPSLNMEISTGSINLGNLVSDVTASGILDIEVGTNAANGLTITARSASGWLTNTSNNALQINNLTTDGSAESYKFTSAINAATDSTVAWFTQSATLDTEVANNSTEHTIYTSNKPQQTNGVNDIKFGVNATTNAQTAAGNYQDKITFTVVGNF